MAAGAAPRKAGLRNPTSLTKLNAPPAVSRSVLVNHFSRTVDRLAVTSRFPKLKAFLPNNLLPWVWHYLKYVFTPRHPFPDYVHSANTGVYRLNPTPDASVRIAIAGD